MKIVVLNGSPHLNGATSDMVDAFAKGAREVGHEVNVINVAHKNIKGCLGCEYCHTKGNGQCIQQDDMQDIIPEILSANMLVLASPIYIFSFTAQLQAVLHRTYCFYVAEKVKKTALILSSEGKFAYAAAIAEYYQGIVEFWGVNNVGIFTANGKENKSEEKRKELYEFGRSLKD